jgi:hypothetical protein
LRVTDLGLLIEDARTNYCLQSQAVSNGTNWDIVGHGITVTADVTTAPDGSSTADLVIPTIGASFHYESQTGITVAGLPAQATWSVYAKAGGYNYGVLIAKTSSSANAYRILVDLTTGAVVAGVDGGSPTNVTSGVEVLGNGWFRLWIAMDAVTNADVLLGVNDTSTWHSFAGDGSSGVYFWGAQVEVGSFPSSCIPTTTTSATRAAENITITGAANTDINAAVASIVAQLNGGESTSYAANVVDSNGTNLLGFDATNRALASISASLATANTANRISRDKLGIAWSGAGRSLVLNGGTVATDATAQTPSATQNLGSAGATSNFAYAYIERLTIWTSKLADATLQGFTT